MMSCRANLHKEPCTELPTREWLIAVAKRAFAYEACGKPAQFVTFPDRRPLCAGCAEELRQAMRDPDTLGNVFAGGRARTEEEIARLVQQLPGQGSTAARN